MFSFSKYVATWSGYETQILGGVFDEILVITSLYISSYFEYTLFLIFIFGYSFSNSLIVSV